MHLLANLAYPILLVVLLLLPWTPILHETETGPVLKVFLLDFPFFSFAFLSLVLFYAIAVHALPSHAVGQRLFHIPLALALAIGITISQTRAVYEGFFGDLGVFQRTPKQGSSKFPSYRSPVSSFPMWEFSMSAYLLTSLVFLAAKEYYSTLWFLALCAFGFLFVSFQQVVESRAFKIHGSVP